MVGSRRLLRSVLTGLLTLWVVSLVIFVLVDLYPKDPAFAALGSESTPEQRERFREAMHLDDPPVVRYGRWLGDMVRGDFGVSTVSARPFSAELMGRLWNSIVLMLASFALSVALALPMAVFAARRAGGRLDTLLSSVALTVAGLPSYVLGFFFLLLLASQLRLLPVLSSGVATGDLRAYALPVLVLAVEGWSHTFRLARVNIVETLSAPYVRSAILRGFSSRRILWRHVMPNVMPSIVNVLALNAIYLFTGVIVIENVFAYPGLGTMLRSAIGANDFPMIQAIALIMSAMVIGTNMLADAAVVALSPRLRSLRD
jgi:peptide/nickel transport system permease protein